jgi:hypothetical protein
VLDEESNQTFGAVQENNRVRACIVVPHASEKRKKRLWLEGELYLHGEGYIYKYWSFLCSRGSIFLLFHKYTKYIERNGVVQVTRLRCVATNILCLRYNDNTKVGPNMQVTRLRLQLSFSYHIEFRLTCRLLD